MTAVVTNAFISCIAKWNTLSCVLQFKKSEKTKDKMIKDKRVCELNTRIDEFTYWYKDNHVLFWNVDQIFTYRPIYVHDDEQQE